MVMPGKYTRVLAALCLVLVSALMAGRGAAAREFRIFDEVWLEQVQECRFIEVRFNIPMRYIKHFPYERGEDLRIQLEPLAVSPAEKEALFRREYPGSLPAEVGEIADVVYEGDIEGGPFLSLYFHDPLSFKVGQGQDFRSLFISIAGVEDVPCDPLSAPPP